MRALRLVLSVSCFLLMVAVNGEAGTRACTNALVTAGVCPSTSWVVYTIAINTSDPDGAGPLQAPSALILDAFAGVYGYQSPTPCTAEMAASGLCTLGQIGASVTITRAQWADFQLRFFVLRTIRNWNLQSATAAAAASAQALPDPDIGN